ncbi:MAG: hypothetical protein ACTS10_04690 [Kiloniellales bacterium]
MRKAAILFTIFALTACSYNATVPVPPTEQIYSRFNENLPGRYTVFIDASAFGQQQEVACAVHKLTFDAREPFRKLAERTVATLVEATVPVEQPLSSTELRAQGFAGQIIIEAEDIDVELERIYGPGAGNVLIEVELTANLTVDGLQGRLLEHTTSSEARTEAAQGVVCSKADRAVSEALGTSFARLTRELGEMISNEPSLRNL